MGCFIDAPNSNLSKPTTCGTSSSIRPWCRDPMRAMLWSFGFIIDYANMTIEKCEMDAATKGYEYFGLENGKE